MPVFNAQAYLAQAVESIQNQTHTNWELIIFDDFSTDGSFQLAIDLACKDSRIQVHRNGRHRGPGGAANMALPYTRGQFIARMDSDDISLPDRFEKQVAYLQANPAVIAVGGQCQLIDSQNNLIGEKLFPTNPAQVEEMMFYYYPIQQPSVMINTDKLPNDFVWYNEDVESAEEHELLFKFFQYGKVTNLPDTVLKYRIHNNNVSRKHPKHDFYYIFKTRLAAINTYGYRPSITGYIKNLLQFVIITVLPEKSIYPLYAWARGMKEWKKTLSFPSNLVWK